MTPEQPRPHAALTAGLLARKGAARPAMRPQGLRTMRARDDLGWDDLGAAASATRDGCGPIPAAPRSVSRATAMRIGRETRAGHEHVARAAFTLRLDTDRHLKLRLASAVRERSAQHLVIEALDAFLETLPEVGALLSQLLARAPR